MKVKEIDVSEFTAEQFDALLGYCQENGLTVGEGTLCVITNWSNGIFAEKDRRRYLYVRDYAEAMHVTYGVCKSTDPALSIEQPGMYELYKPSFHTKCVMTLKEETMVTVGSETMTIDELRKTLEEQGVLDALCCTNEQ
ncbi:hypothetical protein QE321_gp043 [Pseudomonas phage SPA01]|uniref:Uncharacterized protein n=1 Tax=Pseudomonas phage SPA01 TaxID=3003719 RepID=A0A9Y1VZJ6_9CAUD|nr:hypothetical protein QE321_gp043 [Pseudomonas phage SPA01]WFG74216.1 hypothetical protein DOEKDBNA_00175 [Pseudomonas phage SPA01]